MIAPYLILGATGSFGGAVARELLARGLAVRALARDPQAARVRFGAAPGLEWIAGDAQDGAGLARIAAGAGVIVHGVNYPYNLWRPQMTSATANVIAAAKAAGAAILFPGNVYGLGRTTGRPVDESAPMRPCSRKGLLRVELENALRVAAAEGARVLIVRAGDFFGPSVRNGMVDRLFGLAAKGKAMQTFGRLEVPHQWAYMPDLARAAVDLMAGARAAFEVVHYAGIVADPARAMCEAIARAAGQPDLKARVMPWWLLRLAGIFDPVARELIELGYLWDESLILDGGKLRHLLPAHRDTPLPEAVAATLADYRLKP